jgi:hypothetical protein
MATKKNNTISPEKIELYKKLILTMPNVELKGATMPYTSHNGHMFSFLDKDGKLGLRLAEKERETFMTQFKTSLCKAHGTVLKEYVEVPEKIFNDTKTLKAYFKKSFEYVDSLKPKPTKKS